MQASSKIYAINKIRLKWLGARSFATKMPSSNVIRQQFLDFFIKDNDHKLVKSSSVIPFCDPSLSFTNAGMNQFKNILVGKQVAKYKRVANSQKCIRVGGKHNDLSIVGTDGYHHTFFEMLGNWSFGDYFKKEACEMGWKLLTEVYQIPKERLYVTYFVGDKKSGLKADLECREIWLQLGVSKDRIIGCGTKENFWEMASTGPCGRCTEIHLDHLPTFASTNRSKDVNQDKSDLTELWNIVFIENFRRADGTIEKLKEKHVDTGMGFERLVAFLQERSSNYETDLFMPIFDKIAKVTNMPIYTGMFEGVNVKRDTSYRILADHSRMVAISLADGMFPEQNQKLRRILRKCILISENHFGHKNLLNETIPIVANILGETFPELHQKLFSSLEIIKYEQELFKMLRDTMSNGVRDILHHNPKLAELNVYEYPGFIRAFYELNHYRKSNKTEVSGDLAFNLHTSFGLDLPLIKRIAEIEDMTIDVKGFEERMQQMKMNVQSNFDEENISMFDDTLPATCNDSRYDYSYDKNDKIYRTKAIESKILAIFDGQKVVESTAEVSSPSVKLIFAESPFYYESGGQQSDEGFLSKGDIKYPIKSLGMQRNFVLHEIERDTENPLKTGDLIKLHVNDEKRTECIRNHTATHLLNAVVRNTINLPTYQKSSAVTNSHLKIELAIMGPKLNENKFVALEENVRELIKTNLENKVRIINSQELEAERNVVMVPGEIYPDTGIRLVNFGDEYSKELCCGTHAFNTNELIDFTFLNIKSNGRMSYIFSATTGQSAVDAIEKGEELLKKLQKLSESITEENFFQVTAETRQISTQVNFNNNIAYFKKIECQKLINDIKEMIKQQSRNVLGELLDVEMKSIVKQNEANSFIVHYLACSDLMKSVSLQKATRYVNDKPVLILSLTNDELKARCCVPTEVIGENFDADKWLSVIGNVFKSKVEPPKGQNSLEVCFMKSKKVKYESFYDQLDQAIHLANNFAINAIKT